MIGQCEYFRAIARDVLKINESRAGRFRGEENERSRDRGSRVKTSREHRVRERESGKLLTAESRRLGVYN